MAASRPPGGPAAEPPEPRGPEPEGEHVEPRRGLVGPFTGRQLASALAIVVAAALLLVVVTRPIASLPVAGAGPRPTQFAIGNVQEGLLLGSVAPSLSLTGPDGSPVPLHDITGAVVDLGSLRGRPVWVNFWASWCPPCQSETPILRSTFEAYRSQGLALIGISVQESTVDDVRAYARKYGLQYTVAADLFGELFRRWKVYGLPTQFFIDGSGVVRAVVQGPVTPEIAAANLALLGLAAPSPAASGVP